MIVISHTDTFSIPAHYNIYNGDSERMLRIDYAIPENGTNESTGIFIFVPGFGAHIDSKIYSKMRRQLADKYNVVTVQCEYFGSRYMQSTDEIVIPHNLGYLKNYVSNDIYKQVEENPMNFLSIIGKYPVSVPVFAAIGESENEFADMGYMQAIDNITAIEAIKIILKDNNLSFNENKIIGYGQSQGAYLLHLMNRLAPHLFSKIIDNSAWVQPVYLKSNRVLSVTHGVARLNLEFDYFAKKIIKDIEALSLHNLYKGFDNGANVYSCLGTTDNLVNLNDKKESLEKLDFIQFEVIDESKIDGVIFKSTNHGVGADFIELIDYALLKLPTEHENTNPYLVKYIVETASTKISVDYSYGLPVFSFMK